MWDVAATLPMGYVHHALTKQLINLHKEQMYIGNGVFPKTSADCPCKDPKKVLSLIDDKLAEEGVDFIDRVDYGTSSRTDMEDMSMLLSFRRAFLNRSSLCEDCLGPLTIEEVCSKILTIIHR